MKTQTEKAKSIGMKQGRFSTWCKIIAENNEKDNTDLIAKGECARVLRKEGKKIIVVEDK